MEASLFLNTVVTLASLRLFGKHFCVNIYFLQMSFNGGAQKSEISFKHFTGIPFFLAVVSLSIFPTLVLEK